VVCGNPLSTHLTIGSSFLWSSLSIILALIIGRNGIGSLGFGDFQRIKYPTKK
jgi:hypothetical protein